MERGNYLLSLEIYTTRPVSLNVESPNGMLQAQIWQFHFWWKPPMTMNIFIIQNFKLNWSRNVVNTVHHHWWYCVWLIEYNHFRTHPINNYPRYYRNNPRQDIKYQLLVISYSVKLSKMIYGINFWYVYLIKQKNVRFHVKSWK